MSTVAVLQPSFLPWLGHFDQMIRADHFVFYDDVQYDKHGWRNRNRVKSSNGEPHWLTVPVLSKNQNKPLVREIEIDNTKPWARKLLGSVRQFYSKAPFFSEVFPQLETRLLKPTNRLIDLNLELTQWLRDYLKIATPMHLSSELGIDGSQTERLLNICRNFGANRYLSGNAAQDYLDVGVFAAANVEVVWQDYVHPTYPQLHGPFVPYLSVLDLLMNVGANSGDLLKRT